jgi:N6-adenosine-specific RNA methylase IME4
MSARVILADPPWDFRTRSDKGKGRSAENHYPTMTMAQLMSLDIARLAAPDAVLLLWTVQTHLHEMPDLQRAWGFKPVTTAFTWAKLNKSVSFPVTLHSPAELQALFFTGMGYYTRANPEVCLLATRGKPLERKSGAVRQLVISPRREHSRKPDEVHEMVEALFDGPYLELFARAPRAGWRCVGNDPHKFGTAGDYMTAVTEL